MKKMMTMIRSYSELMKLKTFEERFNYLKLDGVVGRATFGSHRYLNQALYNSDEWEVFRNKIIARDLGCDLGCEGYDIYKYATVHHINPITKEDILNRDPKIFDPENVITTSSQTHRAIHYSDESILITMPKERSKNDTCPWRQ